jgi:hypothetical protein
MEMDGHFFVRVAGKSVDYLTLLKQRAKGNEVSGEEFNPVD